MSARSLWIIFIAVLLLLLSGSIGLTATTTDIVSNAANHTSSKTGDRS